MTAQFALAITTDGANDRFADQSGTVVVRSSLVQLDRSRMTLGRRPYNDIVLDHITVSGEHALLERKGAGYELIDTGSSNGSFVNGLRVTRKRLAPGDYVGIGAYQLQLVCRPIAQNDTGRPEDTQSQTQSVQANPAGSATSSASSTSSSTSTSSSNLSNTTDNTTSHATNNTTNGITNGTPGSPSASTPEAAQSAQIEYLTGPLKGISQQVDRSLLKIGRGAQVAIIGRRKGHFYLTHLEGVTPTQLNGLALTVGARNLTDGDLITLGETQIRFRCL